MTPLFEECKRKRNQPVKKSVVAQPIISQDFASRGQVDLIDIKPIAHTKCKYINYKLIITYQNKLTKFSVLRHLDCKYASKIVHQLEMVFLLFGIPTIIQSNKG